MRLKTLPLFTLATYPMCLNFYIRVTGNTNSITVGLIVEKVSFPVLGLGLRPI